MLSPVLDHVTRLLREGLSRPGPREFGSHQIAGDEASSRFPRFAIVTLSWRLFPRVVLMRSAREGMHS